MRTRQFRLKTIMIVIAFVALGMTVVIQSMWMYRTTVREQRLRALLEYERASTARNLAVARIIEVQGATQSKSVQTAPEQASKQDSQKQAP